MTTLKDKVYSSVYTAFRVALQAHWDVRHNIMHNQNFDPDSDFSDQIPTYLRENGSFYFDLGPRSGRTSLAKEFAEMNLESQVLLISDVKSIVSTISNMPDRPENLAVAHFDGESLNNVFKDKVFDYVFIDLANTNASQYPFEHSPLDVAVSMFGIDFDQTFIVCGLPR